MSSNFTIQKVCEYCNNVFDAKTTVTRYCSHSCNRKDYKEKLKAERVQHTNKKTAEKITKPIEQIQVKEFLSVRDVSTLLGCSVRTVYRLIDTGTINAVKLSERITRISKNELTKLIEQPQPQPKLKQPKQYDISEMYSIGEVQQKFNISNGALYNILKREKITKFQQGKFVYVPKEAVDILFNSKK